MRDIPFLFAVYTACFSGFSMADLECNNGFVCADIRNLDEIAIIPEESDLTSSTNRDIVVTENYCALSYLQSDNTPTPYDIAFRTGADILDLGGGNFVIGTGETNAPSVKLEWRGNPDTPYANIDSSGLSNDTNGARFCEDNNAKASIKATLNSKELQNLEPGRYDWELSMDMGQGSNTYHSRIPFQITLPNLVKISGLEDMAFTEKVPGKNFYRKDERFCIFVWGGGSYTPSRPMVALANSFS